MTPPPRPRRELFDRWAASYDESVIDASFPLAGYDDVLDVTVRCTVVEPRHRVLVVGIGTGNLAARVFSLRRRKAP